MQTPAWLGCHHCELLEIDGGVHLVSLPAASALQLMLASTLPAAARLLAECLASLVKKTK